MEALITALFIAALVISAIELFIQREGRPFLAVACCLGFAAAVIWRVQ